MIGRVVSTKMKNTAVVLVERVARHPLYKKTFIRSKRYLVDDTFGVKDGDIVEIIKVRPVSKNKHFKIVKVVGQNLAEIVEAQQKKAAEEIVAEVMLEEKMEESSVVSHQAEEEKNEKSKKSSKGKESLKADS